LFEAAAALQASHVKVGDFDHSPYEMPNLWMHLLLCAQKRSSTAQPSASS